MEQKVRPPLHEYIRKLLFKDLTKITVEKVLKQMRKLPWDNMEVSTKDHFLFCRNRPLLIQFKGPLMANSKQSLVVKCIHVHGLGFRKNIQNILKHSILSITPHTTISSYPKDKHCSKHPIVWNTMQWVWSHLYWRNKEIFWNSHGWTLERA